MGKSELINDFGHDLKKLLKRTNKFGLTLTPDTQEAIKRLARTHREHWARYPKENVTMVFGIEQFEKNAAELLEQVRVAIYLPPWTGDEIKP